MGSISPIPGDGSKHQLMAQNAVASMALAKHNLAAGTVSFGIQTSVRLLLVLPNKMPLSKLDG
jgi:hypothetical protein